MKGRLGSAFFPDASFGTSGGGSGRCKSLFFPHAASASAIPAARTKLRIVRVILFPYWRKRRRASPKLSLPRSLFQLQRLQPDFCRSAHILWRRASEASPALDGLVDIQHFENRGVDVRFDLLHCLPRNVGKIKAG